MRNTCADWARSRRSGMRRGGCRRGPSRAARRRRHASRHGSHSAWQPGASVSPPRMSPALARTRRQHVAHHAAATPPATAALSARPLCQCCSTRPRRCPALQRRGGPGRQACACGGEAHVCVCTAWRRHQQRARRGPAPAGRVCARTSSPQMQTEETQTQGAAKVSAVPAAKSGTPVRRRVCRRGAREGTAIAQQERQV
jgi:hypothetical protein